MKKPLLLKLSELSTIQWLFLFVAFAALASLFSTLTSVWSLSWPQIDATVTTVSTWQQTFVSGSKYSFGSARQISMGKVFYSYNYSNRTFNSSQDMLRAGSWSAAMALEKKYPQGSTVKVRVNPLYPAQSTLTPGNDLSNSILLLVVTGIFSALLAAVAYPNLLPPPRTKNQTAAPD